MNSLLLSKAKCTSLGEWVTGYYALMRSTTYRKGQHVIVTCHDPEDAMYPVMAQIEIDPATLCRATGETDAYGNLIYDKDLLAHCNIIEGVVIPDPDGAMREVMWVNSSKAVFTHESDGFQTPCWLVKWPDGSVAHSVNWGENIIIGNAHDISEEGG